MTGPAEVCTVSVTPATIQDPRPYARHGRPTNKKVEDEILRQRQGYFIPNSSSSVDQVNKHFPLTQVDDFEYAKEFVFKVKVLWRCFGAVVLDEGKRSCSEDVVVGTLYLPVEVGLAKLVIDYSTVAHTEGCPGGQFALVKMTCQNLRGRWTRSVIPKCAWEEHKPQKTAMDHTQNSCHCLYKS